MQTNEQKPLPSAQSFQIDSSLQNRRKRRSKNDESGRDFQCECGKSYLSYSALYTHSKVKHNSKITLEQSLYTTANNSRAHKVNFIDLDVLEALEQERIQYSLSFLQKLLVITKKQLKEEFNKIASSKKFKGPNGLFLERYKTYWENREKDDQIMDEEVYLTTIDHALGYLLIQAEKALKKDEFMVLQAFLLKVRYDLNEMKYNPKYTEVTTVFDFPLLMNDLFTNRLKASDMFKENPTLSCMLIYNICRWLLAEKFTTLELKISMGEE